MVLTKLTKESQMLMLKRGVKCNGDMLFGGQV